MTNLSDFDIEYRNAKRALHDAKIKLQQENALVRRTARHTQDVERRKSILTQKLNKCCVDCGWKCTESNYPAFHWDHMPGQIKLFQIAQSTRQSLSKVMAEIMKCELRCANCHAIITYIRKCGPLN